MFVCPVPKISLVVMKWRRASHHGRFTLWHNGNLRSGDCFFFWRGKKKSPDRGLAQWPPSYTTRQMYFVAQRPPSTQLGGFTLWHNRHRATQLCKFTLWHNGRRVKSTRFDACTRCRTHFPKTVTNHAEKYEGSIQSKILLRLFDFSKLFKDERFGRVSKHRSIVDLQQTLEITFYLLFIQQTFKR